MPAVRVATRLLADDARVRQGWLVVGFDGGPPIMQDVRDTLDEEFTLRLVSGLPKIRHDPQTP
jgi:hypothetical protein